MSRIDKVKLYHGDCLVEHEHIEDGSVDLILTDLPYGNIKGSMKDSAGNFKKISESYWDTVIEPKKVYEIANRILRKNGKMLLFSQQPYTTRLINDAISNIPFSYIASWNKNDFANALGVNKAMVGMYEDILLFSKNQDVGAKHPVRDYSVKLRHYTNYSRERFRFELGHYKAMHFMEGNKESAQFNLCTEHTYNQLIEVYRIDEMTGFKKYSELLEKDEKFKSENLSTFNLWEGNKYKPNILEYKKDYTGHHPTQKPILLLEDLIKTFSNEGNLVVDLTMGSGSTGVACVNTNRHFTGIEMDDKYFNIAKERIEGAGNKDQSDIFDFL